MKKKRYMAEIIEFEGKIDEDKYGYNAMFAKLLEEHPELRGSARKMSK